MDTASYEKIEELIRDNPSITDFAEFGTGTSAYWIARTEQEIGQPLPETFKWWLSNYRGGEIGGEEIFSIYELEAYPQNGGDLVSAYRRSVDAGHDPRLIPLLHSDIDGVFYFTVELGLPGNEYRIFSQAMGGQYADNFLEFIDKRISLFKS